MRLPAGAEPPVTVFVNGSQLDDDQYRVENGLIHFSTPLRARQRLSVKNQILLACGIGVYGDLKGDSVDLQFFRGGIREIRSDLRPRATGPQTS